MFGGDSLSGTGFVVRISEASLDGAICQERGGDGIIAALQARPAGARQWRQREA
jgi:hypothetical protein